MEDRYSLTLDLGQSVLRLPVLPEKLTVSAAGRNRRLEVLDTGQVLQLRKPALCTLAWEGFFPQNAAPYTGGSLPVRPRQAVEAIVLAWKQAKPVEVILTGGSLGVNGPFGIEHFSYEERWGEPGDIYYALELTQWVSGGARQLVLSGGGAGDGALTAQEQPANRDGEPDRPGTYTVVRGDCLWTIAKRFYGSGTQWRTLYDANRDVVGANPNLIYPGQVLTIP
jgi:nucleoid-associated protein YgaU